MNSQIEGQCAKKIIEGLGIYKLNLLSEGNRNVLCVYVVDHFVKRARAVQGQVTDTQYNTASRSDLLLLKCAIHDILICTQNIYHFRSLINLIEIYDNCTHVFESKLLVLAVSLAIKSLDKNGNYRSTQEECKIKEQLRCYADCLFSKDKKNEIYHLINKQGIIFEQAKRVTYCRWNLYALSYDTLNHNQIAESLNVLSENIEPLDHTIGWWLELEVPKVFKQHYQEFKPNFDEKLRLWKVQKPQTTPLVHIIGVSAQVPEAIQVLIEGFTSKPVPLSSIEIGHFATARKKLGLIYHPDRTGKSDDTKMQKINESFDILKNSMDCIMQRSAIKIYFEQNCGKMLDEAISANQFLKIQSTQFGSEEKRIGYETGESSMLDQLCQKSGK